MTRVHWTVTEDFLNIFLYSKSVRTLRRLRCLEQVRQVLITSQLLSCHDLKQRSFVISVSNVMKHCLFEDN